MKPLYVTVVGSHLYGMNTPTSDRDIKGICFEDTDAIIGLKTFEQQETKNNAEDGPDKVEGQIYSVMKYVGMCMKGNPTAIEVVFAPDKFHIFNTEIGKEICQFLRDNMLTQRLFPAYSAYHRAQLHKMQSMTRIGKRANEVTEFGYDRKFAGHAYRLAVQCIQVLTTGTLIPTMSGKDLEIAMNMRMGVFSKEETLEHLLRVDKEMYDAHKITTIPSEPDFNKVNDWMVNLYMNYLNGKYDSQLATPFDVKQFDN